MAKEKDSHYSNSQRGFTLLEIVAVMVISAIITAGALFTLDSLVKDGEEYTHIHNAKQMAAAVKMALLKDKKTPGRDQIVFVTLRQLYEISPLDQMLDPSSTEKGEYYHETKSLVVVESVFLTKYQKTVLNFYVRLVNSNATYVYIDETDLRNLDRVSSEKLRGHHVRIPKRDVIGQ
ncbi:MAG: prepilin-type N-terminal cleavage/methylation domain-containing protein [Candidatus Marinamargulisbacteria bacterium]|jgi:prepilin-type N-terminal cleavage/methylation domain-containing protein